MNDEKQLIRRVADREKAAEEEFVERYRGLVVGLARGRFGLNEGAAEDLLQAVMQKLWSKDCKALQAWRGKGRVSSYLTVIATRLHLREREKAARRREETMDLTGMVFTDSAMGAEQVMAMRERRKLVDEVVAELSVRDRLLLALRYDDERSAKEIAGLLGMEPGAARKALHDAVARLRRRLLAKKPELFEAVTGEGSTS